MEKNRGIEEKKTILITGGAGFIGSNAAKYFLENKWQVIIFDNFSRSGTEINVAILKAHYKHNLTVIKGDVVTDTTKLKKQIEKVQVVLHLAAQVAVTTSITNPQADLETNILGTFNVLEAVRTSRSRPFIIYSSTNKVYGALEHLPIKENKERYVFASHQYAKYGVDEDTQLDFHSPYGCSKGSADQYVIDYSRIYGLKSVVFRQSCIYGPYQFGVEDQGWVAWFTIAAMLGEKITLYGNGKQVRDVLHIDDLVRLYAQAIQHVRTVNGKAYNVGGGPANTVSLIEFLTLLKKKLGKSIPLNKANVRAGDQPIFFADIRKLKTDLKWEPTLNLEKGWDSMYLWIREHEQVIKEVLK